MKKVIFTLEGKRFEIELEAGFFEYVEKNLSENGIDFSCNNEASKFLKSYLTVLKENYHLEKHIKILIDKTSQINS